MKKRIIQIFALIFAVGILASCLIVPAAAADVVELEVLYDGMMKDAMYFGVTAPEGYSVYSNMDQFYTVKKGQNAIAFENNGKQGKFSHWRTPFFSADGCIEFMQEYAVNDNNIPEIRYQLSPESAEKLQVARFTTNGRLYYFPEWGSLVRDDLASIDTFHPSEDVQICAFRDHFIINPYTEKLTIRRWYWANGNYDSPVYKFEVVTDNDFLFARSSDGYYKPADFQILGLINYTDDYFQDNVVQIQMTRQYVRTWRLAPTRDEIINYKNEFMALNGEIEDLKFQKKQLSAQVASLEEGLYQMQMNREEEVAEYEAQIKTAVDEIVNLTNYKNHLNEVIREQEATIKDLRDGLDNTNAIGVFLDGIFGGVRNLIVPWFDLGIGGITIGSVLGVFGILAIILFVVKLVRGNG